MKEVVVAGRSSIVVVEMKREVSTRILGRVGSPRTHLCGSLANPFATPSSDVRSLEASHGKGQHRPSFFDVFQPDVDAMSSPRGRHSVTTSIRLILSKRINQVR